MAHSRAAGLVLLTVTCGSIVSTTGRIIALYASHQAYAALFGLARGIATLGLLLDALSVVLVGVWLVRRFRFGIVLVLAIASCVRRAGLARYVREESAGAWPLVVGRALAALTAASRSFHRFRGALLRRDRRDLRGRRDTLARVADRRGCRAVFRSAGTGQRGRSAVFVDADAGRPVGGSREPANAPARTATNRAIGPPSAA